MQSWFSLASGVADYTATPFLRGSPVPAHFALSMVFAMSFASPVMQSDEETLVPAEQVRYDYAEVLRVQPVEQVVTTGVMERRCSEEGKCRQVRVPKELRRTIGYDVDYTYRGSKYRSRLAQDPGRRLRIRIGVTPMVGTRVRP